MPETTVAVTGAAGFIGARVCEVLFQRGLDVRPVVRTFHSAARLSMWPMKAARADILDKDSLRTAFDGADVVVHCAYGNTLDFAENERITIDGTRNVVQAATEAGVRRLVHMSTVAVYGEPGLDHVDESTPYQAREEDWYTRSKQQAEKLMLGAMDSGAVSEVVALQPSIVYGPHSLHWSVTPIERLEAGTLYLYDNGRGICNTSYVDNVAGAVYLACARPGIAGERFLITDGAPVSWKEFYQYYADMLGRPLPSASVQDVQHAEASKARFGPLVTAAQKAGKAAASGLASIGFRHAYALARNAYREKTRWMQQTSASMMDFYLGSTRYDITKARTVLGYEPQVDLASGMKATESWLRFARLIP